MQGRSKFSIFIVSSSLLLLFVTNSFATELGELSHKIAFLKNGEVWVSDLGGQKMKQITSDSGKVDDFLFSRSLKYLAYAKIIGYEDEPGLWADTEKVPQRAVCSIVIMELKAQKVIKEIMPTEDRWIYISKWLPEEKLLYYSSSGFDVSGFYTYDIQKDTKEEIDYNKSSIVSGTEYSTDGSMRTYVDDSGLGKDFKENLHLVDLRTNVNRILVSKRSIASHKISNDKNQIAFVEVEQIEKKYDDNLWVYKIKEDSLKILYRGPAKAKIGGASEISWSFDDRYIGIFFSPEALVIEVQNPSTIHRIHGQSFSWIENEKIIFAQENDTYLYSLETRKSDLLFGGASKPTFLLKKDY